MRRTALFARSVLVTALCPVVLLLGAGRAAADPILPLNWAVSGSAVLAKPGVTMRIPAGATFSGQLDLATWQLTGDTKIPDLTLRMTLFGFLPTTSVVRMVPTAPTTASVDLGANKVLATTTFHLSVLRVSSDWLPSVNLVAPGCRTTTPSVATLHNTTPIDLNHLGMAGTFGISPFTGCGLATPLLTALLSGAGNRMALTFGAPAP